MSGPIEVLLHMIERFEGASIESVEYQDSLSISILRKWPVLVSLLNLGISRILESSKTFVGNAMYFASCLDFLCLLHF